MSLSKATHRLLYIPIVDEWVHHDMSDAHDLKTQHFEAPKRTDSKIADLVPALGQAQRQVVVVVQEGSGIHPLQAGSSH